MSESPQTSWMWHDESTNGVMGVTVDLDDRLIQWYDEPGCACTDSGGQQTIASFLQKGPSALNPPDDVLAEMQTALQDYA